MLTRIDVNLLVTISCLIILAMILACGDKFKSDELYYLLIISTLLILMRNSIQIIMKLYLIDTQVSL